MASFCQVFAKDSIVGPLFLLLTDDFETLNLEADPSNVAYDVSSEKIEVSTLFTTSEVDFSENANSLIPTNSVTALSTFNGNTYFVWVDNQSHPRVTKISADGVTTRRLDPDDNYKVQNDSHHTFSLGIDSQGYIHIAGDMHNFEPSDDYLDKFDNANMMYWVSSSAEDISQFDFLGDNQSRAVPGYKFTYPKFYNDRNMELYMLARINLMDQWTPGVRSLALYRYNTQTKAWVERGGYAQASNIPENYRSILWEDNGHSGSGYQGFIATIMFDMRNRMHLAATINNDNDSPDATHVLYAYSDDGGLTFRHANGHKIPELPMRASGENAADIVAQAPDNSVFYWIFAGVYVNGNGEPAVSYWRSSDGSAPSRTQHWDSASQSWVASYDALTAGTSMVQNLSGPNGVISYVEQGDFGVIKRGLGPTEALSQRIHFCSLSSADRLALRTTGEHIFVCSEGDNHLSVKKISYSNTGSFTREVWGNIAGSSLANFHQSDKFPGSPEFSHSIQGELELSKNIADQYGARLRGMLHVPQTGDYTFWVAGDHQATLWLSSDAMVENAEMIAKTDQPTAQYSWDEYASQESGAINLVAGKPYYFEVQLKEQEGDDHVAVAWSGPAVGSRKLIEAKYLSPWAGVSDGAF